MKSTLILIRGLPGSGKSYLASALQQRLGDTVVVLDPDATDYDSDEYKQHVIQQHEDGVDPSLHAYRFLRAQAYAAIEQGKHIIWNQPFRNLDILHTMVGRLRDHAEAHERELRVLIIEVEISPETARKRVEQRKQAGGHGPSDATFDRYISEHHSFKDAGYAVVAVDGSASVQDSVDTVMTALDSTQA